MKKGILLLVTFFIASVFSSSASAQIAIKGEKIYTMQGEAITNGVVLIKDGKIEQVGTAARVRIPANYEVYEAKVITPGLIDAHSVVGHLRDHGITTVHTGHGPGALISGQTMIVKTTGETVDEALVDSTTMLAFTMGNNLSNDIKKPGSRSKGVAMLRQELIKAKSYAEKRNGDNAPAKDLRMEALADLLDGKIKALITVHKAGDIMSALRLQREFGFPMVLDGVAEAYLLIDEIKASGFPVIIHPTMIRTGGDAKNASMETASKLYEAGIPVAFQSGFEGYVPKTRVVLFEAGVAAANGLGFDNALKMLTIDAAKLLGISDRVGSIERGKDADLVLFNGDPFEYVTNVDAVFIDGKKVK